MNVIDWLVLLGAILGIVAYGNGGPNTDYRSNPYARFGATGDAGFDLQQLIVSPTAAMLPLVPTTHTPNNWLGTSASAG